MTERESKFAKNTCAIMRKECMKMNIILLNGIGSFFILIGLFLLFGLVCYRQGTDDTVQRMKQKDADSRSETKAHFIDAD